MMKRVVVASLALLLGGLAGYLIGLSSDQPAPTTQPATTPKEFSAPAEAAEIGQRSALVSSLIRADYDPWGALADLERRVAESAWHYHKEEFKALFEAWAQRDLDAAIAGLDAIKFGSVYEPLRAVLDVAFERDPEMAAGLMKKWRHLRVLPKWLKENPAEACRLVPWFTTSQDGADHFSFPRAWAKTDPAAALEWARSLQGWQRISMVMKTVNAWAVNDLDAAIAAYGDGSGLDWRTRSTFEEAIAGGLGKSDPARAIEWLANTSLEPHELRKAKLGIVTDWSRSDLDGAIEWIRQQPPLEQKQALARMAPEWAKQDVEAAAAFYLEVGPANQSDRSAAEAIGKAYLDLAPAAALDWVDQLPQGSRASTELQLLRRLFKGDREKALAEFNSRVRRLSVATVEQFSGDFFRADLDAARAWLDSLPGGLVYETAIKGVQTAAAEGGSDELKAFVRDLGAPPR